MVLPTCVVKMETREVGRDLEANCLTYHKFYLDFQQSLECQFTSHVGLGYYLIVLRNQLRETESHSGAHSFWDTMRYSRLHLLHPGTHGRIK